MVDFNRVSIKNKAIYLRALKIDGGIEMYGAILKKEQIIILIYIKSSSKNLETYNES